VRRDRLAEAVGLAIAALVLATLVPLSPTPRLPELEYGLVVAIAGLGGAALTIAASGAAGVTRASLAERFRAIALWAACAAAIVIALAALALTAQTMSLRNIVNAQVNTLPYLLLQPGAALVYFAGAALAGDERGLVAVLGWPARLRAAAEAVTALFFAAFGATLFLAGYAGPTLPGPLWVLLKTALIAATLLALRARFGHVTAERRLRAAWQVLLPAALLNLAVTVVVLAR